jgi:hypothetical protein
MTALSSGADAMVVYADLKGLALLGTKAQTVNSLAISRWQGMRGVIVPTNQKGSAVLGLGCRNH